MIVTCHSCGRTVMLGVPEPHCVCGAAVDKQSATVQRQDDRQPGWVRLVSYFKSPEDKGVGDTVARYAAMLGGEQFKALSKKIGLPCGCTERQAEWNVKWPYTAPHDPPGSSSR